MGKTDLHVTHFGALIALLSGAWVLPNSPALSIAIALVTAVTQGLATYERIKAQPTVSNADLGTPPAPVSPAAQSASLAATTGAPLLNARGTAPVELPEEHTAYIDGPSAL